MEGTRKPGIPADRKLKLSNDVQMVMCVLLIDAGHAKDVSDFVVRYAPLIRMILNGEVYIDDREWIDVRLEVRDMIGEIGRKAG